MRVKSVSIIVAAVAVLLTPVFLSGQQTATDPHPSGPAAQPASRPAPGGRNKVAGFVADSIGGEQLRFPEGYRGKVVLVTFWATWCPKCKTEMPFWRDVYKVYHDQGLEIIGIATDKNRKTPMSTVAEFVQKNELIWPVVYEDSTDLANVYEITSVPTLFLIDGDTGEIIGDKGELRKERLKTTVERALQNKGLLRTPASQPAEKR